MTGVQPQRNLLIVEDEEQWVTSLTRSARQHEFSAIRVARSRADAEAHVDAMRFAVALVDLGLDVDNDQNVDGLAVMHKIRERDPETSIIVLSGRTGPDVMALAHQSIIDYKAQETIGKGAIQPKDIQRLLETGLIEFSEAWARDHQPPSQPLWGGIGGVRWEHEFLSTLHPRGGADAVNAFLKKLLVPVGPLLPPSDGGGLIFDPAKKAGALACWSRGYGRPVVVAIGEKGSSIDTDGAEGDTILGHRVSETLSYAIRDSVVGRVYGTVG